MTNKPSKQYILKSAVIFVLGLVSTYIGKDLLNGETLATIDNIIAGGIGASTLGVLLITLLTQNTLPKSTADSINNEILPIITNSNLSLEDKVLQLSNKFETIIELLQSQEERQKAFLEENKNL